MLNVEVLGGVGEYGRNCFYIEVDGQAILLDCGIMKNAQKTPPKLTAAHVEKLVAVFISHSHIDHVGALPIAERLGYAGPIVMSEMTQCQLKQCYRNTHIFYEDSIGEWVPINDYLAFKWGYSGHVIGSVWYQIRFIDKMIFYSGDYVVDTYVLQATLPQDNVIYDIALIDSGHVEKHVDNQAVLQQIAQFVQTYPQQPIIFPSSFSGKTLDIATYLFKHTARPIYVEQQLQALFQQYIAVGQNMKSEKAISTPFWIPMEDVEDGLYFIAEQSDIYYPQAITVYTGYLKKEDTYPHFFYKTHPDYEDIVKLSKQICAKQVIYFHSTFPVQLEGYSESRK
ncbi:MBL fold metallo-hydrolase [Metasolibacillus meyeri]|uniref:MBL fold metallo-hydrolase n=1 Tax=Metasolibacillus meyeri TaxID=1071052 RepID=A0AAW9NVP2_9BACL|nr:MBL fold metallo-hydrolase [Metasolibacillus meyeri]MEC1178660.1 MBL fold metallo-hydrolase [Metasolibacillus meyeri]